MHSILDASGVAGPVAVGVALQTACSCHRCCLPACPVFGMAWSVCRRGSREGTSGSSTLVVVNYMPMPHWGIIVCSGWLLAHFRPPLKLWHHFM
jgi:hypothetical protein